MRVYGRIRDETIREPRRNRLDRANLVFGLFVLVASLAGVFRDGSGWAVVTTEPFLYMGLGSLLMGAAESAPTGWIRAAALFRIASGAVLVLFAWLVTLPAFLDRDPLSQAGHIMFTILVFAFIWILHHAVKPSSS